MLISNFAGRAILLRHTLASDRGFSLIGQFAVSKHRAFPWATVAWPAIPCQPFRRAYRMGTKLQAFVGEKTQAAGEYHSADFDFWEHKTAVDEQLAQDPSAYQTEESLGTSSRHHVPLKA